VPLLILDIFENLTGARIIPKLREQMQPSNTLVFFDQFDEELNKLKDRISEDFYNNHLINIF
jgi:hypothetical protein